jgi:flagellar motor component MotA
MLERGTLIPLMPFTEVTVVIPLFFGVLFTTMFSFKFKEIVNTFKSAFSDATDSGLIRDYRKNLLIVKNLQSATTFWAATIIVLAIIQLLSNLTALNKIGPAVAAALSALFYAFFLRAALFIPMENSLNKKIFLAQEK